MSDDDRRRRVPSPSAGHYGLILLGLLVGGTCFTFTQGATKDFMDPIIAICTDDDSSYVTVQDRVDASDGLLVPYEPRLGGAFVCMITQFIHKLVTVSPPAGCITWAGVALPVLTFGIVAGVEAGRVGAKGPVRYSTLMMLVSILLGVCVAFPAIWIPSYILGGSFDGPYHKRRPWHAVFTVLPFFILTLLVFWLDPSTNAWTQASGWLQTPILAFFPLLYHLSPSPTRTADMIQNEVPAKEAFREALQIMGVLSFVGHVMVLRMAYHAYGVNVFQFWDSVWTSAHPSVKFMTVDTIGYFIAMTMYMSLQSTKQLKQFLVYTPLLGPGAALSYAMVHKRECNYTVPEDNGETTTTTKKKDQ